MPSGFLKALKKVGLIEVEEPVDSPTTPDQPEPVIAPAGAEPIAEPAPAADPVSTDIAEAVPLDQIYSDSQVPSCSYPAEKLLKVLGGLRAMDLATRKAAINAMDAADDGWRIEDVLLDAERKIKALETRKRTLAAQADAADQEAAARVQAREKQQQTAIENIRKQISDLQALMEREVAKATADKAAALATGKSARDASVREAQRLDQEIQRLGEIPATFASPAPAR